MTVDEISSAIDSVLLVAATKQSILCDKVPSANKRDYKCKVETCTRPGFAKGLCNAHYIRSRNNVDLNKPLHFRRKSSDCLICGKQLGGKGGWGLCPVHYKKQRLRTIKLKLIELFGGKCKDCNTEFECINVYDFHHTEAKDESIGYLLATCSSVKIAKEIIKCILLCANCHRIRHASPLEEIDYENSRGIN